VGNTTIQNGFFTMDTVHAVMAKKNIDEAKEMVNAIIANATTARKENITKARAMVVNANSINSLAMAITNFMLAHPSENLKAL
jgi:glutamyl-tRNA reductase